MKLLTHYYLIGYAPCIPYLALKATLAKYFGKKSGRVKKTYFSYEVLVKTLANSAIGFGAYRISHRSETHRKALELALDLGCDLIDTSSNYTDGESETLIGEVLTTHPQRENVKVVTKAGYIQGQNLTHLKTLHSKGLATEDLVTLNEGLSHSIHPDFLADQLERSRARLKRDSIDCYLLHNPEYYFQQTERPTSQDEYYRRLKKAFVFLEEQVQCGKIKYYGVSSNNFVLKMGNTQQTNLPRLLEIAQRISSSHHFKIIQFPYNMLEVGCLEAHEGERSLLQIAKANGLITLSNRPLNAFAKEGLLRLANYEADDQDLTESESKELYSLVIKELQKKWISHGESLDNFMSIPFLQQFETLWYQMPTPDAVDQIFMGNFFPLAAQIWGAGGIPPEEAKPFYLLYETATLFAKRNMTNAAKAFEHQLIEQGLRDPNSDTSFSSWCCENYLNSGIDHVLVGMRKEAYVKDMQRLFTR